jgi:hypothetical protein
LAFGAIVLALGLSACTDGPGNEDDLVTALTRDDAFTTAEAECIASAVFDEYGEDEDSLNKISGVANYEELSGPDGVPGFDEFFRRAVSACTNS